ncbi:CGNR zinc finger domain-containing protein [Actinophytocola oryzae]|uniref:CGNR zinc finger domain-containing protein n=1 Tax=Actinophytocola oryzae TaxID=502181 RepID=UPI001FB8B43D|nr:CGNR zinc finger domain-containing protein [Actinophytocola oryzae]
MDFDSHTSGVVEWAVALLNEVTPGERHGRPFAAPTGDALLAAVRQAVPEFRPSDVPTQAQAAELAEWAARLRHVVELVDTGDLDTACTELNRIMRESNAVPTLSRHGGEPWHLHFHSADAAWAISWAASMATGLAVVLGNAAVERLGLCNAPACDRVYIDLSRNGTRRFCSTACQNRVKAAAFRARRAAP